MLPKSLSLLSLLVFLPMIILAGSTNNAAYEAPSFIHILGTNFHGEDIFHNFLLAVSHTFIQSSLLSISSFSLALLLAFLAHSSPRNILEKPLFTLCSLLETLPSYLIIFCTYPLLQESSLLLSTLIIFVLWTAPFRSILNQLKILSKSDLILCAQQLGGKKSHIFQKYTLPHLKLPLLAELHLLFFATLQIGIFLGFLGLQPQQGKNLGSLFAEASEDLMKGEFMNLLASLFCTLMIAYIFLFLRKRREF